MPFVPSDGATIEITPRFIYNGQQVENVFHVKGDTDVVEGDLIAAASSYAAWWAAIGGPISPSTLSLQSVTARGLADETSPAIEYTTGLPHAGTSAGAQLPNNATLAVKWLTGVRGRSFRGRTYHLGLMVSQVVGNTVDSGALAIIKSAYDGLLAGFAAAGFAMCVFSKFSGGAPRTGGLSTIITGCTIDPTVDSQRRRLPGRGS